MATAPVHISATANANQAQTTPSFTPAANSRVFVGGTAYRAGVAAKPTISSSPTVTWTELGTAHTSDQVTRDMYEVAWISNDLGATPAAMTVTCVSTSATCMAVNLIRVLSADTNGTAVQTATGEDLANGDPSFTFGSAPGATNVVIGVAAFVGTGTITPPTGYTELSDTQPASTSARIEGFYDISSAAQGPNQATSTNTRSLVLAIELAPASGDATVSGASLTETLSISSGSATGGAIVSGATLSETFSLSAGTATGGATVAGASLTETLSLSAGAARGGATVAGATLTETLSLSAGTATGGAVDGTASGASLTFTFSFSPGTAIAGALAAGASLTATFSLSAGTAIGGATVAGISRTITLSLVAGAAHEVIPTELEAPPKDRTVTLKTLSREVYLRPAESREVVLTGKSSTFHLPRSESQIVHLP